MSEYSFVERTSAFLRRRADQALSSAYRLELVRRGVQCGAGVTLAGRPNVELVRGGEIHLEDGVTLNSRNRGYHINMHSAVKLMADRHGARIFIGKGTRVHGSCIHATRSVRIGERCLVAANCHIMDCDGHPLSLAAPERRMTEVGPSAPVDIQDDVWICANTFVLSGVTIGAGTVVAANSVVSRNLPPRVLAGGVPAVVLKRLA